MPHITRAHLFAALVACTAGAFLYGHVVAYREAAHYADLQRAQRLQACPDGVAMVLLRRDGKDDYACADSPLHGKRRMTK